MLTTIAMLVSGVAGWLGSSVWIPVALALFSVAHTALFYMPRELRFQHLSREEFVQGVVRGLPLMLGGALVINLVLYIVGAGLSLLLLGR